MHAISLNTSISLYDPTQGNLEGKNSGEVLKAWIIMIVSDASVVFFIASGGVNNVIMHVKENAIRVKWELPQCSGNIREIKVQYRKKGQSNWQWELKVATIADKEMTITGLEKGVEYEVRVVVVDTNGVTHETIGRKASKAGKYLSHCSNI